MEKQARRIQSSTLDAVLGKYYNGEVPANLKLYFLVRQGPRDKKNSTARFTGRSTVVPTAARHNGIMADSKMFDHRTRTFDGSAPVEYWTRLRWMITLLYADFLDTEAS